MREIENIGDIMKKNIMKFVVCCLFVSLVLFAQKAWAMSFVQNAIDPWPLVIEEPFAFPFVADIDLDDNLDIVVGNEVVTLRLFLGNGSGSYVENTSIFESASVYSYSRPFVADINCDGISDVLVIDEVGFQLFLGNGTGEYYQNTDILSSFATVDNAVPFVADINSDGSNDILVAGYDGSLRLFLGDGAGVYLEDTSVFSSIDFGGNGAPFVADINIDGKNDVTVGNGAGELKLFLGDGFGGYSEDTSTFASIDVGGSAIPFVADINGDGKADIVVGNDSGELKLFLGDGEGGYSEDTETFASVDIIDWSVPFVADVTGNGKNDIILGNSDGEIHLFEIDFDEDGYVSTDCDDNNASVYPGATEICGDGIDNDCDATTSDTCPSDETDPDPDSITDLDADPITDPDPDADDDEPADEIEPDRDGDLIMDDEDAFPDDPTEWLDTDGDGIGDNADDDDDGDGILDVDEEPSPSVDGEASSSSGCSLSTSVYSKNSSLMLIMTFIMLVGLVRLRRVEN